MAPAVMGRLLARMAGEVGAMTDKDVESFRGSSAWSDSLERFFQRGITGKLTETDKKEMLTMIDNLSKIETQAISGYADYMARQASKASGVDKDDIYNTLMPKKAEDIYKDSKKKEDPNIKKYAEDYNLDYNKAEKILRARCYDG